MSDPLPPLTMADVDRYFDGLTRGMQEPLQPVWTMVSPTQAKRIRDRAAHLVNVEGYPEDRAVAEAVTDTYLGTRDA